VGVDGELASDGAFDPRRRSTGCRAQAHAARRSFGRLKITRVLAPITSAVA